MRRCLAKTDARIQHDARPRHTRRRHFSKALAQPAADFGHHIVAALAQAGVPFVVADQNRERVEALRAEGCAAVLGDASDPAVLIQAHIARARMLVIAVPDSVGVTIRPPGQSLKSKVM